MKLKSLLPFAALALGCCASAASAEVSRADASSFTLAQRIIVSADPQASFEALLHPERWWDKSHTWSGSAANLSLEARAGGCFCERWSGGEVEHARVLFLKHDSLLRLRGALGPMQSMAVTGVLEFQLTPGKDGTQIDLHYIATGADSSKLDAIAPMADKMLEGQMASLKSLLDAQGRAARP